MLETMQELRAAERTTRLGFSDIVKIRNRVMAMKQQGARVLQLEGGEPFMPTPSFIKEAMKRALDEDQTRYAPSSGIPQLLTAIQQKLAERNRIDVTTSDLIVTAGGMHGLYAAFSATLNEGDETIFFSPYWTPIRDLVTFCGASPVLIPWEEVRGGDVAKAIENRLTPRTRVIYLNSPANPTGDVFTRAELESIAAIARDRNLIVISDEAYEDLVYDGEHVSIASLPGMWERTISVYTLSKSFSMTGWRVGYVASQALWMDPMKKLVLNSVNGVSTPSQFAAAAAIADRSSYLSDMRLQYRERRDLLVAAAQRAGFRCSTPSGAFYLFADVRERLGNDSWKAMNTLLERTSVSSVPGVVFGAHGEGHLRMSYSNSIDLLQEAATALEAL